MANPITDLFTGAPGVAAAQNQQQVLGAIVPNLATTGQAGYQQAGNFLQGGYGQARNDLGTGYGAATGAINQGAGGALNYLTQGTQGALGQLGQARTDLTANGGAYAPLSDLAARYRTGADLYGDSLGINGPGGNQRATAAFDAGPAYNWQLDQGIDAINRRANAAGQLVGGNADRDAISYASNLAKTSYGDWQNRLAAYNPLELQATSGAATGNQSNNLSLANLSMAGAGYFDTAGRNKAGIATGQGNSLADLATRYYGGLGANDVAGGSALAGNAIGGAQNWQSVFQNALPAWNDTYKQQAAAENAGSAALWQTMLGVANLGAKASGVGGFAPMNFGGGGAAAGGGLPNALGSATGFSPFAAFL